MKKHWKNALNLLINQKNKKFSIMVLHLIFKDGEMDTSASYAKFSLNNTVIYKVEESDKSKKNH